MLIRKAGSVSGNATVDFADGGYLYAEAEPYVSYGNDTFAPKPDYHIGMRDKLVVYRGE